MLKKKKKEMSEKPKQFFDYKNWEDDFGFLNLILEKKKTITSEFLIKTYGSQLKKSNDYLKDEDIQPQIISTVNETFSSLSESYRDFLIAKYFGSEESLIAYITEDVTLSLTITTINTNRSKIITNFKNEQVRKILEMNEKEKNGHRENG